MNKIELMNIFYARRTGTCVFSKQISAQLLGDPLSQKALLKTPGELQYNIF